VNYIVVELCICWCCNNS